MKFVGCRVLKPSMALLTLVSFGALASPSSADDTKDAGSGGIYSLINISTPDIVTPRQMSLRLDVRAFGGDENTVYFGPAFRMGVANNWELGIGTSLARFQSFTLPGGGVIRHGGSDAELTMKYSTNQTDKYALSGQVGIGLPNTPAQRNAHLTLGIQASMAAGSRVDLYINPRTVFTTDNTIVGIGFGTRVKLTKQVSVIGDYTPIIGGANTIDTSSGNHRSHDVFGAGLRYTTGNGNITVDLGWTNGIGLTTGSSLTPGLGASGALYVALNIRR